MSKKIKHIDVNNFNFEEEIIKVIKHAQKISNLHSQSSLNVDSYRFYLDGRYCMLSFDHFPIGDGKGGQIHIKGLMKLEIAYTPDKLEELAKLKFSTEDLDKSKD